MNSIPHSPETNHQKTWNMENPKLRRVFVCAPGESPHVSSVLLEWRHSRVKYAKRKLHIHCQIQKFISRYIEMPIISSMNFGCQSLIHWRLQKFSPLFGWLGCHQWTECGPCRHHHLQNCPFCSSYLSIAWQHPKQWPVMGDGWGSYWLFSSATALRNMSLSQKENQPINQPMRYIADGSGIRQKPADREFYTHYLLLVQKHLSWFFAGFLPPTVAWYREETRRYAKVHLVPMCEVSGAPNITGDSTWQVSTWIDNSPWRLQVANSNKTCFNLTIMTKKNIPMTLEINTPWKWSHIRLNTSWRHWRK